MRSKTKGKRWENVKISPSSMEAETLRRVDEGDGARRQNGRVIRSH